MRVLSLTLAALLAHWRRHPLQFFSILTGVCLATTLWTGVQALNSQARADYARASAVLTGSNEAYLAPAVDTHSDHATYLALRRAGWRVSPLVEGRLRIAGKEPVSVQLLGVEPLTLPTNVQVAGHGFDDFDLAAFMGEPGQAWISPDTLQRLGVEAGQAASTLDGRQLPPLHVQEQLAPGVIVTDIGHAQTLLGTPGQISRFLLSDAQHHPPLPAELASRLRRVPAADEGDLQRLTESFHLNLTALGFLAFIVGLFIVHASIGLAFEQRRGLLRTLRACGIGLRSLVLALAVELSVLALAGGALGVVLGYWLATLLLPDVAASLRALYGAEVAGQLNLAPSWWLAGLGMSLAGVLLAGGNTLVRAARMPVLALAQAEAWRATQETWLQRQAAVALLLLVVAGLAWGLGNSLASAFTLVAALLLAAALLLPVLLDGLLRALTRWCRGPLSQWFVADSRQQLPALSLALMALLLALGSSVGVGGMTEGFRQTFTGWLNQRLSADLYITPQSTQQGEQILHWLQSQSNVQTVDPQWRAELDTGAGQVQMQAVAPNSRLPQHWPLLEALPDAWQGLASGSGVMLSEQLARRANVALGQTLSLPVAHQPELRVVAIYADYGNPRGHLLVNHDWFQHNARDPRLAGVALYIDDQHKSLLRDQLQQKFQLDGTSVVEQTTVKRWSQEVFERTFAATGALNVLTLLVAGVALFISLLTLGTSRLLQLAPLWAVGVPYARLAWLSLGQTMMLATLTVLLALPLGLLLTWCLVAVVNVHAFGWRLPLYVFPQQLAGFTATGLVVSLLAALLPMRKLARLQPSHLLQRMSHEN